jgi:hypothetical protein
MGERCRGILHADVRRLARRRARRNQSNQRSSATRMILIPLAGGQFAKVSDRDYWLVRQFNWRVLNAKYGHIQYARTGGSDGAPLVLMHRLIAGFPPFDLDHKNRDGLDNCRRNLRPASASQNLANQKIHQNNKTGLKGITLTEKARPWRARLGTYGKRRHLGYFSSPLQAHAAYKKAAKNYYGEFARC